MAHVSSFTFENMSRIGNDSCCVDQTTIQDVHHCNYMLQSYFANDCTMKTPINLATSQPCVNYTGSFNVGIGGCNIDDNSKLLIGSTQTHPRCRIDLFQRPFATVPFLGRGAVCPIMESQMLQGELNTNKRTVTKLTEKSHLKYRTTPLIPSIKESMQNPANRLEESAAGGWIRGGVPSRELTRDRDFAHAHTNTQYL
jgi:hypothetical protein